MSDGDKKALDAAHAEEHAREKKERKDKDGADEGPLASFLGALFPDGFVGAGVEAGGSFKDLGWDLSYRHWNWFGLAKDQEPPPPPAATLVLRGDGIEEATAPLPGTAAGRLAGAHELMRQGQYARAETVFHRLAENEKNPVKIAMEARYYEAECLRLQKCYPEAADTYAGLLGKFPNNPYREQAVQHMYTIANYWLEDTRARMLQEQEVRDGKRWFVWNQVCHPLDSTKPFFDEEGRAVDLLEKVQLNDLQSPLADQSLFLCGSVRYYDEDFAEADYYFSQIHERNPNSPLAAKAVELAIVSKNLSTGGSDYDGRKAAEARILVNAALNSYPEIAGDPEKQQALINQLKNITYQQAEKDYKMAEFWARTGHPGSAYFYFELVRRRYPGTKFAEMATLRRDQLRAAAEKEESTKAQAKVAPPFQGDLLATPPVVEPKPAETDAVAPPVLPPELRR
jgi:outer membrane protein assembly factor BamD (BamD/ComL family)